eukprot:TRINITY_DN9835_c0_g1_i8.p2 TRINITY_DN9835_c0_g1~~TRINITY_DN9835_c0_g1_i8.p2  ORF type:complete len:327 (-),score=-6.40 TRINITY_DN9835_c0_g1_i8:1365-2345(-)
MIPLFILNLWQRSLAFFQGLNDSVKNSCFFCLFDIANFSYFFLLQKIEKDVGDVQVVDNRHVKIILLSSIFLGKYLKIELGISFGLTPAFDCFGGVQQVKGNNVELKIICKKPHSQGYFLNFKKKKKKKNIIFIFFFFFFFKIQKIPLRMGFLTNYFQFHIITLYLLNSAKTIKCRCQPKRYTQFNLQILSQKNTRKQYYFNMPVVHNLNITDILLYLLQQKKITKVSYIKQTKKTAILNAIVQSLKKGQTSLPQIQNEQRYHSTNIAVQKQQFEWQYKQKMVRYRPQRKKQQKSSYMIASYFSSNITYKSFKQLPTKGNNKKLAK